MEDSMESGRREEGSECVRLLMPTHQRVAKAEMVPKNPRSTLLWWIKALTMLILIIILLLLVVKWDLPFLFEKVLIPILQWEATTERSRPVLAIALIASLAFFPVPLISSDYSMWLAGIIFGYGIGFVIIMVGTTIGMILPYLIGLSFRDHIHQWPMRYPS